MLIGFTGERGAGKTTAANHLVEKWGFTRMHAFGPGKAMAKAYFIYLGCSEQEAERMINNDLRDQPCWRLPGSSTPRHFMEELGYWMPKHLGVEWTLGGELRHHDFGNPRKLDNFVAESIVYESEYFKARGGKIIRMERDIVSGIQAQRTSAAQKDVRADITIHNTGSIEALQKSLDIIIENWAE